MTASLQARLLAACAGVWILKSWDNAANPPVRRPAPKKPMKKCALPGCNNDTSHNGGYCCAEHCKEHRKKRTR